MCHAVVSLPTRHSANISTCEIRSGMSVQDLKYLTAQRQRLEFWSRMSAARRVSVATDFAYASSPTPTCESSLSASSSPPYYSDGSCYSGTYSHAPLVSQHGHASDTIYVTHGGQVVSLLAGVVNAPQVDFARDH
ncbi:unnamed protein product [Hyaloperonospora brassicae]|uniref:RxLR effector candidate protein n=1 Tax=Hyaloperonospora brassicae TaxID=162125 RepID=A0AAV0TXN2_HYABA|nr:unnamed protein product [Hyaloperonospora brassicae]